MRISDWSSDVCSSDLYRAPRADERRRSRLLAALCADSVPGDRGDQRRSDPGGGYRASDAQARLRATFVFRSGAARARPRGRSEEHTSELQSLMRISYAVFCLKKKKTQTNKQVTEMKD